MSLKEYKKKRNFAKTPEPAGKVHKAQGNAFVIQKHAATRLHYDFRIELDGTLKSWAVPKGPSYDPSEKHLAVHVEDHPLEYGSFEGTIPKGQYGGGTVMLWDRGTWEPLDEDPKKAYRSGKLKMLLHGEKLKGAWALIRMKSKNEGDNDNWLLFKEKDDFADPEMNVTEALPDSVVSGRTLEEIAGANDAVWQSNRAEVPEAKLPAANGKKSAGNGKRKKKTPDPDWSRFQGAKKKAMPEKVRPQLCTLVKEVPKGEAWVHEIKFDGYRLLAQVTKKDVTLLTRNGKAWTEKFPEVAAACARLDHACVLDGEVVVVKPDGTSDFQALQNLLRSNKRPPVVFYVFDLLWLDGYDVTGLPLLQRKELLEGILANEPSDSKLRYSEHIVGSGRDVFVNACKLEMEGVISKRVDSTYVQKRVPHWVKTKCIKSQEFVIGGFSDPAGARNEFGALLLGYYDGDRLRYAGRVGTGFNEESLKTIGAELRKREQKNTPFDNPPRGRDAKGVHWMKPELVCEVEFTEWTRDDTLRHPSFKGLREDKPARNVVKEVAAASAEVAEEESAPAVNQSRKKSSRSPAPKKKAAPGAGASRGGEPAMVAGVSVSNPGRELYPEGITKLDLVRYYDEMADWVLPYIGHRPLTLVRCPQGRSQKCFYQKHMTDAMPEHVRGIPIREKNGEDIYLIVDNKQALLELTNLGVLEYHIWGAREDAVEKPDIFVFDLDPDPGVSRAMLVEATFEVRDFLETLGFQTFLKTTGGKGFHVVVPIQRRSSWDEMKEFTRRIAEAFAQANPKRYVANMSKAKRVGKIYVDYLRNGRGATFVAPYSTRARAHAPVSTPLHWDELTEQTDPAGWNIESIRQRVQEVDDPWADFFKVRQSITAAMKKQVGM